MSDRTYAIVGATGLVGRTALSILAERSASIDALRLIASSRSAGSVVATKWGDVIVEALETVDPAGIDVAIFSAGADRSRSYASVFANAGAVVIDNSSAFRGDPTIPLVVAGVNDHHIDKHNGIIANPNCTTMALMVAAGPLHDAFGLTSMVTTSYQSVSGSGTAAINVLKEQSEGFLDTWDGLRSGEWEEPDNGPYERPIGFNVLPLAGSITDDFYTDEEWKLVNESRKILDIPNLEVEPTCVRVPVVVGHGIAATLRFDRSVSRDDAIEALRESAGVEVWLDRVPTPLDSAGRDEVLVGRIRETVGQTGGINLWVVGDNLRKGAALNTIEIAERL